MSQELGRELAQATVKPFWGRITISPIPGDEEQSAYPLLLGNPVFRGVVVAVDDLVNDTAAELIPPGTVVYHRGGIRIGDVVVVDPNAILAFEAD